MSALNGTEGTVAGIWLRMTARGTWAIRLAEENFGNLSDVASVLNDDEDVAGYFDLLGRDVDCVGILFIM
jgi:hypothetical protein